MIELEFKSLTIFGLTDRREIVFRRGLNVVVGPYGSGKTSMLELMKYALGGGARLSEAVLSGVTGVAVEALVQGRLMSFERNINEPQVSVSSEGRPIARLHATSVNAKGTELASRFLLKETGLPVVRVRRSAASASTVKEPISFWDIYRYAYVSQSEMGQSIAGHADSQLNRKRRRAFELMFGLLDPAVADLETAEAELVERVAEEAKRLADVTEFLERTGVPREARSPCSGRRRRIDGGRRLTASR